MMQFDHSFVEMTQYLLAVSGVQYVLSEKLCQDPVKAFLESNVLQGVGAIIQLFSAFVKTPSRLEFRDQQHWNLSEKKTT